MDVEREQEHLTEADRHIAAAKREMIKTLEAIRKAKSDV